MEKNDNRAAMKFLNNRQLRKLEEKAYLNASDENFAKALAGYIKRKALHMFIWSFIAVVALGCIDMIVVNSNGTTGDLYEDAFEVCKTICSTLLGFVFASKLDDLIK